MANARRPVNRPPVRSPWRADGRPDRLLRADLPCGGLHPTIDPAFASPIRLHGQEHRTPGARRGSASARSAACQESRLAAACCTRRRVQAHAGPQAGFPFGVDDSRSYRNVSPQRPSSPIMVGPQRDVAPVSTDGAPNGRESPGQTSEGSNLKIGQCIPATTRRRSTGAICDHLTNGWRANCAPWWLDS